MEAGKRLVRGSWLEAVRGSWLEAVRVVDWKRLVVASR